MPWPRKRSLRMLAAALAPQAQHAHAHRGRGPASSLRMLAAAVAGSHVGWRRRSRADRHKRRDRGFAASDSVTSSRAYVSYDETASPCITLLIPSPCQTPSLTQGPGSLRVPPRPSVTSTVLEHILEFRGKLIPFVVHTSDCSPAAGLCEASTGRYGQDRRRPATDSARNSAASPYPIYGCNGKCQQVTCQMTGKLLPYLYTTFATCSLRTWFSLLRGGH